MRLIYWLLRRFRAASPNWNHLNHLLQFPLHQLHYLPLKKLFATQTHDLCSMSDLCKCMILTKYPRVGGWVIVLTKNGVPRSAATFSVRNINTAVIPIDVPMYERSK